MAKPFLLFDNYVDPGAREHFEPWLQGQELVVMRPADQSLDVDPRDYRGLLMSGSAASIFEETDWMVRVSKFVRKTLEADVPILGCCFGHQILAYSVAGIAGLRKRATPEVGYLNVLATADDQLISALGSSWSTFVSHEDEVLPTQPIDVLARTEQCEVHGFRVRGARAWGVQFHVEYPIEEEERILRYRADKHPDLGIDVEHSLANKVNSDALATAMFARFNKLATPPSK